MSEGLPEVATTGMTARVCDICFGSSLRSKTDESWIIDGEQYRLSECQTCGVAFTDPVPAPNVLDKFYKTSFSFAWYADHLAAKRRDAQDRYREYKRLLSGSVLDFGGGLGYFSEVCREAGHESVTYDPYVSTTTEAGQWDAVVALHVLEHSSDPNKLVDQLKSYLVPAGTLILAVPNYGGSGYRSQGMSWVWAQPPLLHIFHYTAEGLTLLLERHGFRNVEVTFRDRWDANTWCDVEHVRLTRRLDGAWSRRPFRSTPALRHALARFNSYRRFRGLAKSNTDLERSQATRSELQVTATAP